MRGADAVQRVADRAVENMNLPRNAVKGNWLDVSARRLFALLLAEVWELGVALWQMYLLRDKLRQTIRSERYAPDRITYLAERDRLRGAVEKARLHVKHEAGDCVSFLAMIADRI